MSGKLSSKFKGKLAFMSLGIASLIGWNACLTALDFFNSKYERFNIDFLISIPLFGATNIFSCLIYVIARYLDIKVRIIAGIIGISFTMILIPIQAMLNPNYTGFILTLVLVFILGTSNALCQCSSVAFASLFEKDNYITLFFTGTGIAGLLMGFIRMIFLLSFGVGNKGILLGTIIYFLIAAIFVVISVFFYLSFYKTKYSKYYIKVCQNEEIPSSLRSMMESILEVEEEGEKKVKSEEKVEVMFKTEDENEKKQKNRPKAGSFKFFMAVLWKTMPLPLLIFFVYVQTFMVFPGIALRKNISTLNVAWSGTLLVTCYNIFDTVGKYIAVWRIYNKISSTLLVLFRCVFYATFLLMVSTNYPVITTDWFAFVNMSLFALTNGYATTALMNLAPECVFDDEKETAGFLMQFPLFFGIVCGSFLSLTIKNVGM